MYGNAQYSDIQAKLLKRASVWKEKIGDPDSPDQTGLKPAWKAAGGVVPWLDDDTTRTIEKKYSSSSAPHVVVLLVDDWGFNDVGYNSDYLSWTTPNIDKLASNGIKLTNYYTHELCTPSRAALMTGRYALRFGMQGSGLDKVELPLTEVTMAEELKSAGYKTNLVGKWHLGWSTNSKTPNYRGFDTFYGYLGGYIDYWTKDYGDDLDFHDNTDLVTSSAALDSSVHSAYLYAAKAEAVIKDHSEKHSDKPMFLYYASQLIHTEWAAPQSFIDRCSVDGSDTDELTYCAMVLMLDEVVGNLTCALEKYNMADNTLLVVMSDNGGNSDMDGNCYPYRGAKGSLYRGAESVPAFIYGSESLIASSRRGGTYDGQMHVTDWLPTIMGLATGNTWTGSYVGNDIDGVDMWSAINDNTDSPRIEIVHYADHYGNVSIQYNMNKYIYTGTNVDATTDPDHTFSGTSAEPTACLF